MKRIAYQLLSYVINGWDYQEAFMTLCDDYKLSQDECIELDKEYQSLFS